MSFSISDHNNSKRVRVIKLNESDLDRLIFPFKKHSILAAEYKPLYVIRFEGSGFAMVEGLTFVGSTGIVSFYDIDLAVIDNCTFR